VEDRWHKLSGFQRKKCRDIDIRIHVPMNSETLIEVTGSGKVNLHVGIRVLVY
jgi:hypothetical protein